MRNTPRFAFALGLILLAAESAPAAVVVLGNFTPDEVTCTVAEGKQKPQTIVLGRGQVRPVAVGGPCDVTFPAKPADTTLRLDPYHAYVFIPDMKAGRRLEGVFLPGDMPERDTRPDQNFSKGPLKVPVTLLVDDADPRADAFWQRTVRKRFDEAAEAIRAHAPIQLEFAGFAMWESDPALKDMNELLGDFSTKVKVKPGSLAIGWTSRVKVDPRESQHLIPFGAAKSAPTNHVLLRESGPRNEPEKVEALIQHLGFAFGATPIENEKDSGSVMRVKIADGLALHPQYHYRFDPLNALAMNIWAEELRKGGIGKPGDASDLARQRLTRIYKAMVKERPGDPFALAYINELDREIAKAPEPKPKDPDVKPMPKVEPPSPPPTLNRDQMARVVVRAVAARAKAINGALTGDELTNEYVKAAAAAAWREDGPPVDQEDRMSALLIGLGIALDDTDALRSDSEGGEIVKTIESEADRAERLKVLGNPTLNGRRDWCRRFAIGCGSGELHRTASAAEQAAVRRSLAATSVSLSALAAEFAGIELSRKSNLDLVHVRKLTGETTLAGHLPALTNLREGLSPERLREDYGDVSDPRFRSLLDDIRNRMTK